MRINRGGNGSSSCLSVGCIIVEEEPENIAGITDNSNSPINATMIILCPILNFTFYKRYSFKKVIEMI